MSKNISSIIDSWTAFDIKSIQHELDDKVIEIAQQLEEGDQSRKRLIEQTKEFRKSINEEQRKLVGSILKQFQLEVDSSSKRSKLMEQVLLKLYKQIIDLPDPNPALENAQKLQKKAERVQDLEIENKQLRDTLDDYNTEFAQVKNQEVTIKMLKDKIKELEDKSEQFIQQRVKEKEKDLQRFFTEKEETFQTNQLELVKKLGDTEAKCVALQTQMQKAQNDLYEFKSKQDELLNAKTCEIDILLQDLDKMNERAVNAERLAEQYMQALSSKQNEINNSLSNLEQNNSNEMKLNYQTSTLEIELVAKEKEISQLVEDIQKLQMKSNKSRELHDNQRQQLEERLSNRERLLEQLEIELRNKQDYDEIKRELNILKTIEFNSTIDTDEENNSNGAMITNSVGAPAASLTENLQLQKPLELLLLEKNKHIQNENTQIKNKLNELNIKLEIFQTENANLVTNNLEQKTLIIKLEKDLLKIARSNSSSNNMENSFELSEINLETDQNDSAAAQSKSNDVSLFNIVSNQRERFRLRAQELESEMMAGKQQIIFLTNELDRLRSDNVKLYEKIKFLQSVPSKIKQKQSDHDLELADLDDSNHVLNKYTNEYENKLDPFNKFNFREKQKRYSNLQFHDKFLMSFGRFILSSKTSRLIFCVYFFIIHMLIFFNLYNMALNESVRRDISAECANSYRQHMEKVHGDTKFSGFGDHHNH